MKKLTIVIMCLIQISAMAQQSITSTANYVCPPCNSSCDDLEFDKPGKCNHCNMELITKNQLKNYTKTKEMTIAFYLQDGVEVLDFAGPLEVFAASGFNVFIVSKTTDPIVSQGVLKVIPDYSIENSPKADILAFFGGNAGVAAQDSDVINWIKKQEKSVDYLFSVCTGAFILGQAGVLDNQTLPHTKYV